MEVQSIIRLCTARYVQQFYLKKEGCTMCTDLDCLESISAEKIPSSIVHWYLERKHPCTLKRLVTTCTGSCDILVHLIKRLFNKPKKFVMRDWIPHSHIAVSECHSLAEKSFQYILGCRRKRTTKFGLFCFLMLCFFKENRNFILLWILSENG